MTGPALAPAALAAERLGILGGSFDPPHLGHVHAARAAMAAFGLDHVVFVPAARPPHKPERVLADGADRLAMLALLLAGEAACSTWAGELEREGPSYSVDTVREFLAQGARGLHWILGSDNLPGLPSWREAEELLALVQPVVVHRSGDPLVFDAPDRPDQSDRPALGTGLSAAARARLEAGLLAIEPLDASSSELRRRLAEGGETSPSLPAVVREYAARKGIYTGS